MADEMRVLVLTRANVAELPVNDRMSPMMMSAITGWLQTDAQGAEGILFLAGKGGNVGAISDAAGLLKIDIKAIDDNASTLRAQAVSLGEEASAALTKLEGAVVGAKLNMKRLLGEIEKGEGSQSAV